MRHPKAFYLSTITHEDANKVYEWANAGIRHVVIEEPIDVTMATDASLLALRVLRDSTGVGLSLEWTLAAEPTDIAALSHIAPPTTGVNPVTMRASERW